MEFLIFLVLGLSFPVFYLLGLLDFLRMITGKPKRDRMQAALIYLKEAQSENPKASVKQVIESLQSQLSADHLNRPLGLPGLTSADAPLPAAPKPPLVATGNRQPETGFSLSNWYSENAINVLLYVGAFLIVVTASLFVGFSWNSLSGTTKALALTATALLFYGMGMWLYEKPAVRSAGGVFTGIGTILVPFVGISWHSLVLSPMGVSFGASWTVTSLVWIGMSLLALGLTNSVSYTYVMSLGTVSTLLGLSHWASLPDEYYVFSALMSAFLLVGASLLINRFWKKSAAIAHALELSAQVTVPISLVYGLSVAIGKNILFSYPAAIAILTATVFYGMNYFLTRRYAYAVAAELLLPVGATVLFSAMDMSLGWQALSIATLGLVYTGVGHIRKHDEDVPAGLPHVTAFLGALTATLSWLTYESWIVIPTWTTTLLSLVTAASWISISWSFSPLYLLGAYPLLARMLYTIVFHPGMYAMPELILSLAYGAVAVSFQFIAHHPQASRERHISSHLGTIFFFLLAIWFGQESLGVLSIIATLIAGIFVNGALHHQRPMFLYGTGAFATWAVWLLVCTTSFPVELYSYGFGALFVGLYAVLAAIHFDDSWKRILRHISYAGMLVSAFGDVTGSPLWLFTTTNYQPVYGSSLPSGVIVGTLIAALFVTIGLLHGVRWQWYLGSVVAMFTLTRFLSFLGITDVLLYSTVWGVYVLATGFHRHWLHDEGKALPLDYLGSLILFVPALGELSGSDSLRAAMVMATLGIFVMLYGITIVRKHLTYAGIAALAVAVLSQTYQYILGLEQWMVTGLLGALFLGGALYLLYARSRRSFHR